MRAPLIGSAPSLSVLGEQALDALQVLRAVDRQVAPAAVVDLDDADTHAVLEGAELLEPLGQLQRARRQVPNLARPSAE